MNHRSLLGALLSIIATASLANAQNFTIDGAQQFQIIDGFGVNANSQSWDNGELRPAVDMLVDQLGATIWRVIFDNMDWEATNDNTDPTVFNWTYYNSVYTSAKLEELWSLMSYLNQKGIESGLMLNFMGPAAAWMGSGAHINSTAEDEWVEMVTSLVYYAVNTRGIRFTLLAPMNEPEWDGIEGPIVDAAQYTRIMRKLAQKLDTVGLSGIRLVLPDRASGVGGFQGFFDAIVGDSVVMAKLAHWGLHDYTGNTAGADAMIKSSAYPTKNFWVTEVSNSWDNLGHLQYGPAATLVWDGFDSVYNHAVLAGRGMTPPNDAGNGPALLAYQTTTRVYTPRKAFWEHAQLFKFVTPGSRRIGASESFSSLIVYAFSHPTGRLTVVGRNSGSGSIALNGVIRNLQTPAAFELYETNGSLNLAKRSDVPISSGTFSVTVGANSIFTLTASQGTANGSPNAPTSLHVLDN